MPIDLFSRNKPWMIPLQAFAFMLTLLLVSGCSQNKIKRLRSYSPVSEPPPTADNLPAQTPGELQKLGDLYLKRGEYQTAFMKYDQAYRMAAGGLGLRYKMGLALLLGNEPAEAVKEFEAVYKADPEHAPAHEAAGRAYFQMKDYKRAQKHLRRAIEIDPRRWRAHNYLGIIHDYGKRYDEAIAEYRIAIEINPYPGALYNNLGVSYFLSGHYKDAVDNFKKALLHGYTGPKVYNNLGMALSKTGDFKAALDAFVKGNGEAGGYNNLGCVYLDMGYRAQAIASFKKALALSPNYYQRAAENLKIAR